MTTPPSHRTGRRGPRWLLLASALLALAASTTQARQGPERLTPAEETAFRACRDGTQPPGANEKAIFEKLGRIYAARVKDAKTYQDPNGPTLLVTNDFSRNRLNLQPTTNPRWPLHYASLNANQKQFVDAFGQAMVAALEEPALKSPQIVVRLNAARMVAEVARSGYDGAAELCIKILQQPDPPNMHLDAVRRYALVGLYYLFAIVPDPQFPAKSVFEKQNAAILPTLARRSIQALIDFVFRKIDVSEMENSEKDGVRFVRREAIRALGRVRAPLVLNNAAQVESRPALALLRAARGNGLTPEPDVYERCEAVIGFGLLLPSLDRGRDMNADYAVTQVGLALAEIGQERLNRLQDTSVPWKSLAIFMRESLDTWLKNAQDFKIENAALIKELYGAADQHILQPLEGGNAGIPPNVELMRQWLAANPPASKALFKSDASTTVNK